MEIIDAIKEKFQVWFLIQRDKFLRKELAKIPSDNSDDYYFDNLTNQFIYKDASLNIQVGWENTLNVLKTQIEAVNIHTENLEAIIDDIAQVNIDTTALTAIIANIAAMNINVNNLQAVIANIASIDVDTGNLQAIISDIASMTLNVNNLQAVIANIASIDVDIGNLQAIIADIANIETLNTTISGNITSLTAIIANIGTMNTNIGNLQAIITDIANIETLNTTISGNIATVNTNINNLQAIITDINNIETLTTTISGNITSLTAIIANINTMNTNITNLQAIITDIANIETLNTTISGNVGTMDTNITNLQAIIADIANIETLNTTISGNIASLTAIIANIGTMNTNITNLQAIIADIANIETLNTTISGNITSLTAIIANIGTMNTNISNLQAIITDIANIETQNISMNTALATINTNIGTINTAISNIEGHQIDLDINIESVKDLDIDISEQVNKSLNFTGNIATTTETLITTINSAFLYNSMSIRMKGNDIYNTKFHIIFKDINNKEFLSFMVVDNRDIYFNDYSFTSSKYIKIYVKNYSTTATLDYDVKIFYSHSVKSNEYTNIGGITYLESYEFIYDDIGLLNRLSYTFYKITTAQSYTLKIYAYMSKGGTPSWIEIFNETITGGIGEVLSDIISFTPTSKIRITLLNNGAVPEAYFHIHLFFSTNLLESQISLANLLEKSYNSLTDKPTASDKTRTIDMEIYINNGSTEDNYGVLVNALAEGWSMGKKLPSNCDTTKDVKIIYTWKCELNNAHAYLRRWSTALKTDGSELFAWNIDSSVYYYARGDSAETDEYIYTETYTIDATDINSGDFILMLIRSAEAGLQQLTVDASLEYEVE